MSLTSVLFLLGAAVPPGYTVARVQHGLAAVYWPGDGHSGKTCADGKPFTKERCHIAHRSWPLGSRVRICARRTKRCTLTFVGDRGPFGACDHKGIAKRAHRRNGRLIYKHQCLGRWMVKIRRTDPGTWRGVADLSRCVAKKLGTRGLHAVRLELLRKKRKRRTKRVAQAIPLPTRDTPNTAVSKSTAVSSLRSRSYEDTSRLWSWYTSRPFVVRRRSARCERR